MSEWKTAKLSDVALKFAMGPFGSNIKAENFKNEGIPVIRGTNLNYYKYVGGDFVYLTEEKANSLSSSLGFPGDLVITHRGTLGQVCLVPKGKFKKYIVSQSGMKVTPNPKLLNGDFLFYYLKSDIGIHQLLQHESQVGVPAISNPLTALKSIIVPIPPLSTQHAIAEVLSSLDDKIDLLTRQNTTLEALAQTYFRQWFVKEAKEDWGDCLLSDLVNIRYGKDHKHLTDGKIPVYGSGGVIRYVDTELYKKESVLIPRKGTLGNIMYINWPFWAVDTMFYTEMKQENLAKFIYFFILDLDLPSMNVGSAVPSMTTEILNNLPLKKPPTAILEKYDNKIAAPLFSKIEANNTQIHTLQKLRDTLLPKLISGEVKVKL